MKKFVSLAGIVAGAIAMFFYFNFRTVQGAVIVPPELQDLIRLGIEVAVVFALTQIAKWGFDFSGYTAQIVAALFGTAMVVLNALLAQVPANLEGFVGALLNLLVVVLGAFGLYKIYRQAFPKQPAG